MAKKIVILSASPRKRGLVNQMLGIMRDTLELEGAEVEYIEVCNLDVKPCIGCMKCRSKHECVLPEDDSQKVVRLINECDSLIVGTPCYWGNMNGQLKVLYDRMVYGLMDENSYGLPKALHRGKHAIIVSTCTTIWPFNILFNQSNGAARAVREVLKWSGFKIVKTVQKGGTRKHNQLTEQEAEKCEKAARKLLRY